MFRPRCFCHLDRDRRGKQADSERQRTKEMRHPLGRRGKSTTYARRVSPAAAFQLRCFGLGASAILIEIAGGSKQAATFHGSSSGRSLRLQREGEALPEVEGGQRTVGRKGSHQRRLLGRRRRSMTCAAGVTCGGVPTTMSRLRCFGLGASAILIEIAGGSKRTANDSAPRRPVTRSDGERNRRRPRQASPAAAFRPRCLAYDVSASALLPS